MLVANQFRPQQHLIGPVLFPIYIFVLKIVAAFYLLPWVLVWIGLRVTGALHSGQSVIVSVGSFWTSFWRMTFSMVGSLTILFAILERVQAKSGFLEQWDPFKLPPVRDPNKIPRSESVGELIANMVFCIWWIYWGAGLWYPTLIHFAGVRITLAPTWRYFFWGYLLLGVGNMTFSAVHLFRPYWSLGRASVRLVSDCIGSVLFCWLTKTNIVVAISVANVAAEKTAHVASAINWWTAKMFPWAVIFCVLIALSAIYRIIRVRSNSGPGVVLNTAAGVR